MCNLHHLISISTGELQVVRPPPFDKYHCISDTELHVQQPPSFDKYHCWSYTPKGSDIKLKGETEELMSSQPKSYATAHNPVDFIIIGGHKTKAHRQNHHWAVKCPTGYQQSKNKLACQLSEA
ncbi:hypothetical protein CEXT_83931 [Caerostris extrusa]|uniref:Uncharacterized protein n=1 Tax=Caerostris extrusa TaxID=172846 RepID=A0AAV4R2D6_CAEEX|nr:hypothetical protein CEXT_83931 [Caerostris extrusa]